MVVSSSVSSLQQSCRDDERTALLQFKESFIINRSALYSDDDYPKILQWKLAEEQNGNCCAWDGIVCDERTGHVIGLDLSSSCLLGSINSNSSLFWLVQLQVLNLADNHFNYSRIPTSIRNFPRLMHLNLSNSLFSGQIPSQISQLTKLSSLDLSLNHLTGPIPSIGNLTHLTKLFLSSNQLTGPIPSLGNLIHLTVVSLSSNQLTGLIPSLGNLTQLTKLSLSRNQLTGQILSLGNLTHLTKLSMSSNQLTGPIPSIENLTHLTKLSLSRNQLTGPIPSLGNLIHLTKLSMSSNQLTGQIPSLGNLTHLTKLSLSSNQLTGQILSIGNLTHLTKLFLSSNHLTGPIPNSLSNLINLEALDLTDNNLTGTVEFHMFHKLQGLTKLKLSRNSLKFFTETESTNASLLPKLNFLGLGSCNIREFPSFLQYQETLEYLDLSYNHLHGEVPKWMLNTSTKTLTYMDISHNFLSSIVQHSNAFPWVNLQFLELQNNTLHGPLPMPPPHTVHYRVANNNLNGTISPLICSMTSLQLLDLSNNNMSGTLPPCLGNFSADLRVLKLGNNSFSGFLPETYTNTSSLRLIDVSYNQLRGQLPRSLRNCMTLEFIDLSHNKFSDVFPLWLGALPELKLLAMHQNAFHGLIEEPDHDNVEYFPALRILDLSFNSFRGKFPSQNIFSGNVMRGVTRNQSTYMKVDTTIDAPSLKVIFYTFYSITITSKSVERHYSKIQEAFAVIDISSNKFEGRIPEFIGNLEGLISFNISGNLLTGPIPSSFGNLRRIESLDLSQNKLSGQIPQSLTQLTFLAIFIVSNNNLTGPIPHGTQLISFGSGSYEGNPGLCGDPLPKKCGDPKAPRLLPSRIEENDSGLFEFDWKFVLAGLGSGLVVGVVLSDVVITKKHEWFIEIVKTIKLMIGNS
ncbi:receptor-like protein 35 [Pyrus x bretschneideri]|uniref:receptor-like protein 35 n=1 Tax=Pyrus x bretschneideri TaxID=225117 RepID=UPI00202E722D|nr:receptor-like protein 35 [Pyrus x bretschneideri]